MARMDLVPLHWWGGWGGDADVHAAYVWTDDGACALTPCAGACENLYPNVTGLVQRNDRGGDLATVAGVVKHHLAVSCSLPTVAVPCLDRGQCLGLVQDLVRTSWCVTVRKMLLVVCLRAAACARCLTSLNNVTIYYQSSFIKADDFELAAALVYCVRLCSGLRATIMVL